MTIEALYKTGVSTVSAEMTLRDVAQKMVDEHHNAFVVVDTNGSVQGLVSVQDIAAAVVPPSFKSNEALAAAMFTPEFFTEEAKSVATKTVGDVMRTDFLSVTKDADVMTIIADFLHNDLYVVPVLEDGKLLGIFTRTELRSVLLNAMK